MFPLKRKILQRSSALSPERYAAQGLGRKKTFKIQDKLAGKCTFAVAIDGGLAVALADAAIDALKGESGQAQIVLQHVQHDLELAEYQHLHHHTIPQPLSSLKLQVTQHDIMLDKRQQLQL